MNSKKSIVYILSIIGIIYVLIQIYNMAFKSEDLPKKFSKYIWSSLEHEPLNTQRIVMFVAILIWMLALYTAYFLGNSMHKALRFSIIFVIATLILGEKFWGYFLHAFFFLEFAILGLIDIFCMILRFINLEGIASFILAIAQIITVLFITYGMTIDFCYAPIQFLASLFEKSEREENGNFVQPNQGKSFYDHMLEYERDKRQYEINENLKDINSKLNNMK